LDESILRKAQSGNQQAFAAVLDECYDTVFGFAIKYCGGQQDAEDITQQACIKLAASIHSFRFESAFSTWLYRLVINCARDWYRQQARHSHCAEVSLEVATGDVSEDLVYLQQILARVEDMGQDYRETLVLVAGEGFSHREAGELLGVKESTISWRIHEIRKQLAASSTSGGDIR
jgi:RNA polymerase sigma-70 factor, ECF subfamily